MTALATVTSARSAVTVHRRMIAATVFVVFGLIDILVFGLFAHKGDATFALALPTSPVHVPSIHAPAAPVSYILGAASILIGLARATIDEPVWAKRLSIGAVLLFFVISLLCWADTGTWANDIPVNVVSLLQNTLTASIPLILGALAGCMGERSGVINIAIEGQLLLGAFTAAVVASAVGVLWLGLISGSLAGGLVGLVLALFAIRWLVDQIILGVVLNVLISGLTGYLYDRLLVPKANTYNNASTFSAIKIPGLGSIPILGPDLLRLDDLPVHHLRRDHRGPGRPVQDPLGAAGAGGGRASDGRRHGRHQGQRDQVPATSSWAGCSPASGAPT